MKREQMASRFTKSIKAVVVPVGGGGAYEASLSIPDGGGARLGNFVNARQCGAFWSSINTGDNIPAPSMPVPGLP
jgi:hypothetical protein